MEAQAVEQSKGQEVQIIVNAQPKTVHKAELSFEDVVGLAYDGDPPGGPNWSFTVTYRRGPGHKPQGTLVAGQTVKVKEGMVLNVHATDKS